MICRRLSLSLAFVGSVAILLPSLLAAAPKKPRTNVPAAAAKNTNKKPGIDAHSADKAIAALDVGQGLAAQLFASEPMMLNPTNIDVDERGRVWVCEVVNYRHNNGRRPEGDRILILEDTDGDGQADKVTTFYQGRDIDSALGICVLGDKVIISCSPNVFIFTNDGHDKVARKELLFTKTGRRQHDHSAHTFVFGPDGRLYWNFGNEGHAVHDKEGNPVVDLDGKRVVDNGHPYYGGMVFRCEPDGSRFEVLAHNFRNNYEIAVDSFGTLWQSDNDDDGNRATRINYVMEYGNYGYKDQMTGAAWQIQRTNLEREIPQRHWHKNDPGVVPNLLPTGAGSPCGIMVYEGNLLPAVFRNQMIHCDAGPNIVRAYPVTVDGAGYKARIENMLFGARDNWFRPVDVCAAPDGSLIVADWYDPGVGGHAQGDEDHGRLFRITTPDHLKYTVPKFDCSTPEGAVPALTNPCQSVRYLAWTALHKMGAKADPALVRMWHDENPRFRARALWLLGRIAGRGQHYVEEAIADAEPDIRITGLRLARQLDGIAEGQPIQGERISLTDVALRRLVKDPSPAVRRECAIALRHSKLPSAPEHWATLAKQHDGHDRWFLEALGIGADEQWDQFLGEPKSFKMRMLHWLEILPAAVQNDIVWRSRGSVTPALLAAIIRNPKTPTADLPRYMRAFDFQQGPEKDEALWNLAVTPPGTDPARGNFIATEAILRLGADKVRSDPKHAAALKRVLDSVRGTTQFVSLVGRFNAQDHYADLLKLAQEQPESQVGVDAVRVLLDKNSRGLIVAALGSDEDSAAALATATVLGTAADGRMSSLLLTIVRDVNRPLALRRVAARSVARSHAGAQQLLSLATANQLDARLMDSIAVPLSSAPWDEVRHQAAKLFPSPTGMNQQTLPPIRELIKLKGQAARGREVFLTRGTCTTCHIVGKEGKEIGPNLSEIGDKLSNTALYESILYPSAGISHNYESYVVNLANGQSSPVGLLVNKTDKEVRIKDAKGIETSYPMSDVEQIRKLDISLMPADLQKNMSTQDLADLVAYLMTLKKQKPQ